MDKKNIKLISESATHQILYLLDNIEQDINTIRKFLECFEEQEREVSELSKSSIKDTIEYTKGKSI